jgi:hypothetical protein
VCECVCVSVAIQWITRSLQSLTLFVCVVLWSVVHTFRATSFVVVVSWFSHCLALSCIVLVAATLLCALHGGAWSHLAHVPISRSVHSVGGCSLFSRFFARAVPIRGFCALPISRCSLRGVARCARINFSLLVVLLCVSGLRPRRLS